MNQRVLVFESDAAFADDIKRNFERMGLAVDVALDGPTGLELATSHRPDLILLAIELPGMNGFLVCKKIKKIVELEHVPLVILSSEVDQETFEQHKKLRTRANEYIRKPIAFGELLDRIRGYVPMNGHAHPVGENTAVDIEEAFSVHDDEVIVLADDDPQPQDEMLESLELSGGPSDPESGLELAPPPFAAIEPDLPPMAAMMPEPISAPPLLISTPTPAPRSPLPVFSARAPAESAVQAAAHAAELERFKRELAAMDEKVQAAERRAAMAEQRASGAEKSLDTAKRSGGASSRELLDLREQLNRKDRELLELRDQVTARDKQLIEASDRNLSTERELQDSRDKISDQQRDLEKKSELVVALTGDKDTARKRLDDAKARAERNEAKVRELSAELDELRVQQQAELVGLNNQRIQAEASLRAEHASALEQLKAQHASELESSNARHASETTQLTQSHASGLTALRGEHAARIAEAQRAREEELSELREEHVVAQKSAAERAEGEKLTALEAQREELTAVHSERQAEIERQLRAEHALMRDDAAQRHATELAEQAERQKQEAARLSKTINDVESRFALLEERFEDSEKGRNTAETELKGVREERDQLSARGTDLASQLGRAQARLARDHELVERVRKAMAIGLGLLEEQKLDPPS